MKPFEPLSHPLLGTNFIEASAGTGKTHTIATLFVRLIRECGLSVRDVLVVTYTNAATAELRSRLRDRLIEEVASAKGETARRLEEALHGFDEAAIFTIHGFCQRVLHEHAFESGALFDAELITDQGSLLREVVRDFWVRELHDSTPLFARFLHQKTDRLENLFKLALKATRLPDAAIVPALEAPECVADDGEQSLTRMRVNLTRYLKHELQRRKDEKHIRYFDDLLTRLRDALAGAHGQTLADAIRGRYRAALIDEFQDTDAIQYEIFRRIYVASQGPLFLIGDPKQSIYGFRGADIFTYVAAKEAASANRIGGIFINHRSDPRLLRAVNTIFERARSPFVLPGIEFQPSRAADEAKDRLGGSYEKRAPMQILYRRQGERRMAKGAARERLYPAVAAEVARFLASGATIDGESVRPDHIAILCRMNDEARQLQKHLRVLRIPSVLETDESVFETEEAEELERVLFALAEPGDNSALLSALATPLFGVNAAAVDELRRTDRGWDVWTERFHRWHLTWLESGFVPSYRSLLDECDVPRRVLREPGGERRMTNLLHLGEILQTTAIERKLGPLALAEWLADVRRDREARSDAIADAAQIRLESDDLALKLVTVHKCKGLQFPVVFCPFLWDGRALGPNDKRDVLFHDSGNRNRLSLDLGSDQTDAHVVVAQREALAESLRVVYVALTRAKHRCVLVWGLFNQSETSALAYLLHQPPSGDPERLIEETTARVKKMSDEQMVSDLTSLAAASDGSIEIAELSEDAAESYIADREPESDLVCRQAQRKLRLGWRTSSFSGLVAGGELLSGEAEEGVDRDDLAAASDASSEFSEPADDRVPLADFPVGTRAGLLIHSVFEHLDFAAGQDEVRAVVGERLSAFGFDASWRDSLGDSMFKVLRTPLVGATTEFSLADIERASRLNEMEFIFPVRDAETGQATLNSGDLAAMFTRHATQTFRRDYIDRLRQLGFAPLSGYLKGFVDLIFAHQDRWYIVDYKSNLLGPNPASYRRSALVAAMEQHHYFLQYHLYALALHRYLTLRLAGYDFERHFGGVYYLFVRGMSPSFRPGTGIFFDRPPAALIEALSNLMRE